MLLIYSAKTIVHNYKWVRLELQGNLHKQNARQRSFPGQKVIRHPVDKKRYQTKSFDTSFWSLMTQNLGVLKKCMKGRKPVPECGETSCRITGEYDWLISLLKLSKCELPRFEGSPWDWVMFLRQSE